MRGTQLYEVPSPMVMAAATTIVVFGPVFALFGLLMFGGWVSDEGRGGGGGSVVVHGDVQTCLYGIKHKTRKALLSCRAPLTVPAVGPWTVRVKLSFVGCDEPPRLKLCPLA